MSQPEKRADAVVFDLDGLLINTEQLYDDVGDEILRRRGRRFSRDLKDAMMGRPGPQALQIMIDWHSLDDDVQQLQTESEEVFMRLLPERLAPMPGVPDLLAAIDACGVRRAIATSSRRVFVDRALQLLEFDVEFDFVLSAEDVRSGKPDPEIYVTASQRLQLPPPRMLVLEDSATGCRAAVAAGALTVAVPGTHSEHQAFDGVAFVADSIADPRIYEALGLAF